MQCEGVHSLEGHGVARILGVPQVDAAPGGAAVAAPRRHLKPQVCTQPHQGAVGKGDKRGWMGERQRHRA